VLKHGVDYADEIAVRPATFPANVEFAWHWPLVPPKDTGVYGYNALSFGCSTAACRRSRLRRGR